MAQPRNAFACARGRGKTRVTADRDKIEFTLFNSSSILNITLRELWRVILFTEAKPTMLSCTGFMALVTWVKFLGEKLKATIPLVCVCVCVFVCMRTSTSGQENTPLPHISHTLSEWVPLTPLGTWASENYTCMHMTLYIKRHINFLIRHIIYWKSLTPVAGLIFETKNRAIFLERIFGRGITAREQLSRAVMLARF